MASDCRETISPHRRSALETRRRPKMDIDHLLKLVQATLDEGERTSNDGPALAELEAYIVDVASVRKPLIGAVRKEAFVQGYMRGLFGELGEQADADLLAALPDADLAAK